MIHVLMVVLPLYAEASILSNNTDRLDSLKVTWSPDPFNSNAYDDLPRTVTEATDASWVLNASCSDSNPFLGNRYIKDNDTSAMLLFDKNGYIAGIQVGIVNSNAQIYERRWLIGKGSPTQPIFLTEPSNTITVTQHPTCRKDRQLKYDTFFFAWVPKNTANGYPYERLRPPFVENGDMYVFSVYFTEPSTICSKGRCAAQFESQGTANGLWIQNSTSPLTNTLQVPANVSQLAGTSWTKGKCFRTMGLHYWYNITADMNCEDFQPIFLLYNRGKLNAFGWALGTNLNSPRYEHPPFPVIGAFMEEVPRCLENQGTLSTMHIYLGSNPLLNNC